MISRSAKYALGALRWLAMHPGERQLARELAAATGAPRDYLAKVMKRLEREGCVEGRKGWGGGFVLTARGGRRTVLEIVELFDGRMDPRECLLGLKPCSGSTPCPLHESWSRVRATMIGSLGSTRVATLGGPAPAGGRRRT